MAGYLYSKHSIGIYASEKQKKNETCGEELRKKVESSVEDRSGFSTENDEAERLFRPQRSDNNRDRRESIIKFPPWSSTPLKKLFEPAKKPQRRNTPLLESGVEDCR